MYIHIYKYIHTHTHTHTHTHNTCSVRILESSRRIFLFYFFSHTCSVGAVGSSKRGARSGKRRIRESASLLPCSPAHQLPRRGRLRARAHQPSAYVSTREHTSASVSIRQHTSAWAAYVSIRHTCERERTNSRSKRRGHICIRQDMSAYVSICQHTQRIRQHT